MWVGALAAALLTVGAAPAGARAADTVVRFQGYRITVPSSWPVFDLTRHPGTCVRFNRHAVYLGVPSSSQRCPAHAAGRTEAILLEPLRAGAASAVAPRRSPPPLAGSVSTFAVPDAGVTVTATWAGDRTRLSRILGPLPAPARPRLRAAAVMRPLPARRPAARAIPAEAVYTGLGFDACSAPSTAAMTAWSASPYRSANIYIGGVNSACSQPNLTAAWTSGEVAAGWHLIPTYVGLQGAGACGGTCATISPSQAGAQGTAAASDAVAQAQALAIPAGNPIYDDMEQYSPGTTSTAAVLAYLAAWTAQLHAQGYLSGVYSSASSAITDLVRQFGTGYTEPDDLWIAHWNNLKTVGDSYVPSTEWASHQRIHQYDGGHDETYGGVTLNIDGDYLDGATADTGGSPPPPPSLFPDGTFVDVTGSSDVYVIAGGAPLFVTAWSQFGGPQPVTTITPQQFAALRPYPADGTFVTTTAGSVYRIAGGAPIPVRSWTPFGGQQPSVTIDSWDVGSIADPRAHLRPAPTDGTVVEGLPSHAYWSFAGGLRSEAAVTATAVGVDDAGLTGFSLAPQSGGVGSGSPHPHHAAAKCVVPRLKHMSLARAKRALRRAHCGLGKVRRPRHWGRHHLLRVFGQSAGPHSRHASRFKINLRLL